MTVNNRQAALLLFCIVPASKFLLLPALYAGDAAQDVWLAGLINFLADGALLAVVIGIIKKYPGKSLFDVLSDTLGRGGAKTVYALYAVFFFIYALVPLFEHKKFIEITLYETTPSVITFLPAFFVIFYLCLKGVKIMARTAEFMFRLIVAALAAAVFMSAFSFNPFYLLPIARNPLNLTLKASYGGMLWYGQPLAILFLAGGIKGEKGKLKGLILSFAAASLICVVVFAFFTGIFGDLAPRKTYALPKMMKYAVVLSNMIRFDYLAVLLLVAASVLSLSVPSVLATECVEKLVGGKGKWIAAVAIVGAQFAVIAALHSKTWDLISALQKYFTPAMIALAYIVPALVLFFGRKRDGEKTIS